VDNFTNISVAATRLGAADSGACSPWTNVVGTGANHALGQSLVLAAGAPDARRHAAFWQVQPMSARTAPLPQMSQLPQSAAVMAADLLLTIDAVNVTRKPKNVHKTRINAGGYGAMGPYPERERLA
jgi:hypothetical protein